jgi:UDP-2,3-diacylglucosamine pyrophosphatase LpxH
MANRYLVLSDIHLCDMEDHADGWKAHKSRRFQFDEELESLVTAFEARAAPGDALTLVLNGDILDFDLVTAVPENPPWPVRRSERRYGLDATGPKSAWKLRYILGHHPRFAAILARFLAAGHQIVYLLGNHDRELHFPEVRQAFVEEVERAARALGLVGVRADAIRFEPWFFYVPGEIYVEHGQQYDYYSSFRNLLEPVVPTRRGPVLDLPMGNLTNRIFLSRMGYFNPHGSNYILNFFRYIHHWLKYYAFTRHSLVFPWLWGSVVVMLTLLWRRKRILQVPRGYEDRLRQAAKRAGVPLETVQAINRLQRLPIIHKFYRIVREFWIDRVFIAILMTGGTIALALGPVPLWVKLMVPLTAFPLLYSLYEWLAQGESVFTAEHEIPKYARQIAELTGVKVVTFGHTHRPRLIPLARDTTFVDTGSWAPVLEGESLEVLAPGYRNYLMAEFLGDTMALEVGSRMEPRAPALRDP